MAGGHLWQGCAWQWGHAWQGGGMHGGGMHGRDIHGGGHPWQRGMHDSSRHAWQGREEGIHGRGMCGRGGMAEGTCMEGGHVWQERRPLQRTVRILLECILVYHNFRENFLKKPRNREKNSSSSLAPNLKSANARRLIL